MSKSRKLPTVKEFIGEGIVKDTNTNNLQSAAEVLEETAAIMKEAAKLEKDHQSSGFYKATQKLIKDNPSWFVAGATIGDATIEVDFSNKTFNVSIDIIGETAEDIDEDVAIQIVGDYYADAYISNDESDVVTVYFSLDMDFTELF